MQFLLISEKSPCSSGQECITKFNPTQMSIGLFSKVRRSCITFADIFLCITFLKALHLPFFRKSPKLIWAGLNFVMNSFSFFCYAEKLLLQHYISIFNAPSLTSETRATCSSGQKYNFDFTNCCFKSV